MFLPLFFPTTQGSRQVLREDEGEASREDRGQSRLSGQEDFPFCQTDQQRSQRMFCPDHPIGRGVFPMASERETFGGRILLSFSTGDSRADHTPKTCKNSVKVFSASTSHHPFIERKVFFFHKCRRKLRHLPSRAVIPADSILCVESGNRKNERMVNSVQKAASVIQSGRHLGIERSTTGNAPIFNSECEHRQDASALS